MVQGAQFRILRVFESGDVQQFAYLCREAGYPTDLGGYYIRQLVSQGYLEKGERGQYIITPKGKQQFPFGSGSHMLPPRPRLNILIVAHQNDKYLLISRDKQPFIGKHEWPAGSVELGETLSAAADRITSDRLLEDHGQPRFVGFFRRIDRYEDTIFDDKLFAVHTLKVTSDAEVKRRTRSGTIVRYPKQLLESIKNPAKSLLDIARFVESGKETYTEREYHLGPTDLAPEL